jgi:hypothetical protein
VSIAGRLQTLQRRVDKADRFKSGDVVARLLPRDFRIAGKSRPQFLREMIGHVQRGLPRLESDDRAKAVAFVVEAAKAIAIDTDPRACRLHWTLNGLSVAREHAEHEPDAAEPRGRVAKLERNLAAELTALELDRPDWLELFIDD